ncbi:macrolide ABC transporter ATP-binding protein [Pacificimonas flava]|uniref:Macrolide ABC transporter ATP-binding protein n=2 Tax=Pacificimonas TaxID=1960290 RepID=A0A219B9N8_9SPHN|nr:MULTISPECIES: ABC transporter ATP-binding protein [Pacificimonas]MBZ6380013.1 ABC transporter ATP-binding protein [Pacificimonas aurantium]OWV34529.1 macrolide ABC transporter ATP-binding protein [Pacificimonas flava]
MTDPGGAEGEGTSGSEGRGPEDAFIRLRGAARTYGEGRARVQALLPVDLDIAAGDYVSIAGPSGSGKTTMMNLIGCLDRPSAGSVEIDGRDVAGMSEEELARLRRETIGFVFQQFNLLPRSSARDNVAMPLVYHGVGRSERERRADDLLQRVGLGDRTTHRPNELSGGQQQRVAIARALVGAPRLILADEPTGALDTKTSGEIIALLESLNREEGVTLVVVTHEPALAARAARRIAMLDGRIQSDERGAAAQADRAEP